MKPMRLFGAKKFSGEPVDGIDNATKAIFGHMTGAEVELLAFGIFEAKGALKKMRGSRAVALLFGEYDALWSIGHVKEIFIVLICRLRRMKYCINFHTILLKNTEGRWRVRTPWFLRKFLFSRADIIITPSEFSAGTVRRYFPKKNVVGILNGVDVDSFHPGKKDLAILREKYHVRTDKPIIAFVGTLQARKRPDVFIEIARRFPNAHFVAVGRKTPEEDFLAGSSIPNFQWIPLMPREDIAVLLASSYAFVFPSLDEPSAAVILEAMASGAVPVLSKSGGNGEFLEDGKSGFLIPYDSQEIEMFTGILAQLVSDKGFHENISAAARREAERHSFDIVAEQYKKAILSLFPSRI